MTDEAQNELTRRVTQLERDKLAQGRQIAENTALIAALEERVNTCGLKLTGVEILTKQQTEDLLEFLNAVRLPERRSKSAEISGKL